MDVFGLGLKIKEEGAATVEASLKRLGAELAKTALTVGGLGAAFSKLVASTSEAQFATAQLESTLQATGNVAGVTANMLTEQATALQRVTTYGDDAIVRMQSLLLVFSNIRGEVLTRATPAILNLATTLQMDLSSAAMMVGKALQDPAQGLMALNRSTKLFSEEQKKMLEQMAQTGQLAEAQAMILQTLESRFNGAAEAARGTLGGALTALREAFGDLFEVSQTNTAGVVKLIESLTSALVKVNENMLAVKTTAIVLGGVLLGAFAPRIAALITGLVAQFVALQTANLAAAAAAGIHSTALVTLTSVAVTAATAFRALWAAMGGPVGVAVAAAVAGYAAITHAMDKKQKAIDDADAADQERMEREIARIRAERQARIDAEAERAEAIKKAVAADKERIAQLIELNSLLPRQKRDFTALAEIERRLQEEFNRSNTALGRKVELLRQLQQVRTILYEVDTIASKLTKTFEILGKTFAFTPTTIDTEDIKKRLKVDPSQIKPKKLPVLGPFFDEEASVKRLRMGFREYGKAVEEEADRLRVSTNQILLRDVGMGLGKALEDGIIAGLQAAIMSGKISDLWKAMAQTMLSQIANMMVNVALYYIKFASMIAAIQKFLIAHPVAAVAAAAAMLAFAYANGGKSSMGSQTMAGGIGGLSTGITSPSGATNNPVQQIIFGSTSATTAAGMQPRQAMNVTIIGPNDASAQRAMQELMNKANSRGRVG